MKHASILAVICLLAVLTARAEDKPPAPKKSLGYSDTPMLPGDKWHVHDGDRPQPRAVAPGAPSTQEQAGTAPADAIVLFDGKDLSKWKSGNADAKWAVENGYFVIVPKTGELQTREEFGDCQLHIEFSAPTPPKGDGQGRGNSGVFLMGRYEFQVLDSYENPTYPDGQAASIYAQYPPLVNASRKPGEWQAYDIIFTAPRFKDGKLETPAYITAFHNGVLVHNHVALMGGATHRQLAKYTPHGDKGPLKLQDHGDPVRFRNIWIRPLKGYDEQ